MTVSSVIEGGYALMLREGLLGQWAEELNLPLRPEMVTPGSHRMVWWRCEHGHVWRAAVYSRSVCGTGCPVCAGVVKAKS